jgi:hypothetical protein
MSTYTFLKERKRLDLLDKPEELKAFLEEELKAFGTWEEEMAQRAAQPPAPKADEPPTT